MLRRVCWHLKYRGYQVHVLFFSQFFRFSFFPKVSDSGGVDTAAVNQSRR